MNGNVYKNTGDGWQKYDTSSTPGASSSTSQPRSSSTLGSTSQQPRTTGSWQNAGGDTSWADREQQARAQGENRFNSFSQNQAGNLGSTGESRFGGGGDAGGRFGGGGFRRR